MRKFTGSEKRAGEMAIRRMSKKAQEFYNGTDPLEVFEYEDSESGVLLYAYSGCLGDDQGMTFEQLQSDFEAMYDEFK